MCGCAVVRGVDVKLCQIGDYNRVDLEGLGDEYNMCNLSEIDARAAFKEKQSRDRVDLVQPFTIFKQVFCTPSSLLSWLRLICSMGRA